MKRETQNVLVLLLGLAVGVMVVKGAYLHYVKPSLMPWLLIAAAVLIALALVCIVRDIRNSGSEAAKLTPTATATAVPWCGCCWCPLCSSRS